MAGEWKCRKQCLVYDFTQSPTLCLLLLISSPQILKEDIKVFFVKYNDPIYVKLEKLDIMIRLASAANIGSVLTELKEWVEHVHIYQ